MIDVIELKLERSLAKVESLITKNLMDAQHCRTQVTKLQKIIKSPVVNSSVNLNQRDRNFFRKMIGGSSKKKTIHTPRLTRDQVEHYQRLAFEKSRSGNFIPPLNIPKRKLSSSRKVSSGHEYNQSNKSRQVSNSKYHLSDTMRVNIAESDSLRDKQLFRVVKLGRGEQNLYEKIKEIHFNQDRDSDLDDIQHQIERIEESEYNSETKSEMKNVKYLDIQTARDYQQKKRRKPSEQESLVKTESNRFVFDKEHHILFKGMSGDGSESHEFGFNEVFIHDAKRNRLSHRNSESIKISPGYFAQIKPFKTPPKPKSQTHSRNSLKSQKFLTFIEGRPPLPIKSDGTSSSKPIQNPDEVNLMGENERVMKSSLQILPIYTERVQKLISNSPNLSPERLKSSFKKSRKVTEQKPLARTSSYYEGLFTEFDKHPGYGCIDSRFAFNKHSYSDKKTKEKLKNTGRKDFGHEDPSTYAFYVKDSIKPAYSEILSSRNEEQWPSMKKSSHRKKKSARKSSTKKRKIRSNRKKSSPNRLSNIDRTTNNNKKVLDFNFNAEYQDYPNLMNRSFESQETVKHKNSTRLKSKNLSQRTGKKKKKGQKKKSSPVKRKKCSNKKSKTPRKKHSHKISKTPRKKKSKFQKETFIDNSSVFNRLTALDPRLEYLKKINSEKKQLIQYELDLTNRYTDSATMKQLNQLRDNKFDPYPVELEQRLKRSRRRHFELIYGDDIMGMGNRHQEDQSSSVKRNVRKNSKSRKKRKKSKGKSHSRARKVEMETIPKRIIEEIQLKMYASDSKDSPFDSPLLRKKSSKKRLKIQEYSGGSEIYNFDAYEASRQKFEKPPQAPLSTQMPNLTNIPSQIEKGLLNGKQRDKSRENSVEHRKSESIQEPENLAYHNEFILRRVKKDTPEGKDNGRLDFLSRKKSFDKLHPGISGFEESKECRRTKLQNASSIALTKTGDTQPTGANSLKESPNDDSQQFLTQLLQAQEYCDYDEILIHARSVLSSLTSNVLFKTGIQGKEHTIEGLYLNEPSNSEPQQIQPLKSSNQKENFIPDEGEPENERNVPLANVQMELEAKDNVRISNLIPFEDEAKPIDLTPKVELLCVIGEPEIDENSACDSALSSEDEDDIVEEIEEKLMEFLQQQENELTK